MIALKDVLRIFLGMYSINRSLVIALGNQTIKFSLMKQLPSRSCCNQMLYLVIQEE